MTMFARRFVFELSLYVLGFIAYTFMKMLGAATLRLGRAVFSR